MDLSICILTRNQGELLQQCVVSCIAEIERTGMAAEVIIIDNASSDGSPQRVATLSPAIRVIRNEENLGFSAANNRAIRSSRGSRVLILNDDAVLREGSLRLMLRKLDCSPDVAALGPKLLNPDGSPQWDYTNKRFPHLRGVICQLLRLDRFLRRWTFARDFLTLNRDMGQSGETDHVAGACLLLQRRALDAVGLFDEAFYFWYEDADLCHRLKKAGWKIYYLAEAEVIHWGSSSFKKLMRSERAALAFNSLLQYFQKHASTGEWLLTRAALVGILVLRLPIALAATASWRRETRKEWKGIARQYCRTISSILVHAKS